MSYIDLLERICDNDSNAFVELTDRYGWAVYSAIRKKYSDKDVADMIYNETMNAFYNSLSVSAADPLESLLVTLADRISPDMLRFESPALETDNGAPIIQLYQPEHGMKDASVLHKKNGIGFYFCVLVILISCIGTIWCALGLMMKMNIIPYLDLGYSWFNGLF